MKKVEEPFAIKGRYVLIIIILLVVIYFLFIGIDAYKHNQKWKLLNEFDNKLTKCSLDLSTYANTQDYNLASIQITSCRSIVNDALFYIYKLQKEYPNDEDIIVANLDYQGYGYVLDIEKLAVDPNRDVNSIQKAIELINMYIENFDEITNSYSETAYYKRYWVPNIDKRQKNRQDAITWRNKFQSALDSYNE